MILTRFLPNNLQQTVDLRGLYRGRTAVLLGGAPSLMEQPYQLLEQRGVLVLAMNNAARHVRPALFCGADNPNCYDPQILQDPCIMKFGNIQWAKTKVDMHGDGRAYWEYPGMLFWRPKSNPPWDELFVDISDVPWYRNTLLVSIHILYNMGVRRIILAGSDFMSGAQGDYAHGQELGTLEKRWNLQLYNNLVRELRLLKPIFEANGLELLDSSKNSRLAPVYQHIDLQAAVALCLSDFPAEPLAAKLLPHCSRFATRKLKDIVAGWPGHEQRPPSAGQTAPASATPAHDTDSNLQTVL